MKKHFQFHYNFIFFLFLIFPILSCLVFFFVLSEGEESTFLIGAIVIIVLFLATIVIFRNPIFSKVYVDIIGIHILFPRNKAFTFRWQEIMSLKFVYYLGNIYMRFEFRDYREKYDSKRCLTADKDGCMYIVYRKSIKKDILHECNVKMITQPLEEFKKTLFIFNQKHLN